MKVECRKVRLGELGEWGSGGTPLSTRPEFYGGSIPWIKIGDLNDSFVTGAETSITELGLRNSSAKMLNAGTLLIAMYGSIGKLGITTFPCATNQAIASFRPGPEIDLEFSFWLIRSLREDLQNRGQGGTQSNVSQTKLKSIEIELPPMPMQRRIVARIKECMDRIDEIALLRGTSALESKVLHRSFYHEQYERLISNGKTVRLEQAAKFMGGGTPSKQNPSFWMGTIPWISPKDMKRRDLYDATDHISDAAISGSSTKLTSEPSVLFVVRGMILAHTLPIAVNRVPVAINQDMKAAVPTNGFDVDFLAAMLRGAEKKLLSQVEIAGHGTCRLQQPHWTGVPIPVLSQSEQADVVAATQAFESIADRLRTEVTSNESEAMRAAVLRKAFAGEL